MLIFSLSRFVQELDRHECAAVSKFRGQRKLLAIALHLFLVGSYTAMVLNHGRPYYMAWAALFTLAFLLFLGGCAALISTSKWLKPIASSDYLSAFSRLKEKHGDNVLPNNRARAWFVADYLVAARYDELQAAKLRESLRDSVYQRLKGSK